MAVDYRFPGATDAAHDSVSSPLSRALWGVVEATIEPGQTCEAAYVVADYEDDKGFTDHVFDTEVGGEELIAALWAAKVEYQVETAWIVRCTDVRLGATGLYILILRGDQAQPLVGPFADPMGCVEAQEFLVKRWNLHEMEDLRATEQSWNYDTSAMLLAWKLRRLLETGLDTGVAFPVEQFHALWDEAKKLQVANLVKQILNDGSSPIVWAGW